MRVYLLAVALATLVACNSKNEGSGKQPQKQSGPAQLDQEASTVTMLTPKLVAEFNDYSDENEICRDKKIGDVILQRSPGQSAIICLGELSKPDKNYLRATAPDASWTGIYVTIFTDTVNGVRDLSYLVLFENADSLEVNCESTIFSSGTRKLGYGSIEAAKSNDNQMQSLISGRGICNGVNLESVDNRTDVEVSFDGKTKQKLPLTKIR